jgi:cysteine desulfurase
MSDLIYLDHAATTPLSRRALEAMMPYLTEEFGNPSSIYAPGRRARRALDGARETVAAAFGAHPDEIYFTSGGTESDNWVIRGAAGYGGERKRIVTSAVEHHAVLRSVEAMQRAGYETVLLGVDEACRVSPDSVRRAADRNTALVSVMAANNEVGTIMPIAELAAAAHETGALFHTDAVQAAGHIPLDVESLGVDMMSFSAHKFGGPKGVGGLYVRRGVSLGPGQTGGGQERGLRSGTENVAGAVGAAAALEESCRIAKESAGRLAALRDRLIHGILAIPGSHLTGDPENRLPGNASFVFDGVEGEALVFLLDSSGICASSGSACAAGALEPSHVLLAMGLSEEQARGSLRLTLGPENTEAEINNVLKILPPIIFRLRGE